MFMSHSCAMKCLQAVTYQLTVPKLDDRRPSKIYRQVKRGNYWFIIRCYKLLQKRKKLKRTQNCEIVPVLPYRERSKFS